MRWNGTGTQQLQITPFLTGTTGATLYIVFTVSSTNNYNLIRTYSLDDYWRFSNDGNGYFGSFTHTRFTAYPATMPSSGSHLVSIHVSSSNYEVLLDNLSKGAQTGISYVPGTLFQIATNDKTFNGDIATLLVYPSYLDKSSAAHTQNIQAFKNIYPSLSLS